MTRGGPATWKIFEVMFQPWLRRRLDGIHLANLPPEVDGEPRGPLVLVANHVSWFDGFLLREIQRRLRPSSVFRTIMLEDQLRRNPVLHGLGGMGLDPDRPISFKHLLRQLQVLRASPGGEELVVSFFPQGRIYPSFRRPLGFQPGLRLLLRSLAPCTVQEVGIHIEPGNTVSPEAFILGGERRFQTGSVGASVEEVESGVARTLDRIHTHLAHLGEDAGRAWPSSPDLPLPAPTPHPGDPMAQD